MKRIIAIFLTVFMVIACFSFCASAGETTRDFRYNGRFNATLISFNDLALITDSYYPIPGLEKTSLGGEESCNAMTPQGLCVTEDYVFISAYCGIKKYKEELEEFKLFGKNGEKLKAEENHKVHNSVIYILDRETGAYLKTLVLPDNNHVGGLATDGKNIFISKSSDKQVSVISATQIDLAMQTKSFTVNVRYMLNADCGCTASFVTYYNEILWVGVFNEEGDGELKGFSFKNFGTLEKIISLKIPEKANGAAFCEINGETNLVISSSYGRKFLSKAYLYTIENYGKENMILNEKDVYTLPPVAQNFAIYDGKVYHIYESAATCYSQVQAPLEIKSTSFPVDRVCIGQADNLFGWHSENLFMARISAFVRAVKTAIESIF